VFAVNVAMHNVARGNKEPEIRAAQRATRRLQENARNAANPEHKRHRDWKANNHEKVKPSKRLENMALNTSPPKKQQTSPTLNMRQASVLGTT
jgi:hypothetical protein